MKFFCDLNQSLTKRFHAARSHLRRGICRSDDDRAKAVVYHDLHAQDAQEAMFPDCRYTEMMNYTTRAPTSNATLLQSDTVRNHRQNAVADLQVDMQILVFECQGRCFAVPISYVQRVVLSAEPVHLPGAPDIVLGILNVAGEIVTVLDFARRVGCAPTTLDVSQQFLIVDLADITCALVVDTVTGVHTIDGADLSWPSEGLAADFVDAMVCFADGLCLVIDLEQFLFASERLELAQSLAGACHAC